MLEAAETALKLPTLKGGPSAPDDQETPPSPEEGSEPSEAEGEAEAKDEAAKAKADAEDEEFPEVDEKTLPHPQREIMRRWKTGLDKLRKQVDEYQPAAEQYGKVQEYMETFGLTADDVAMGFDIMAKMRTSPQHAFEALKPIFLQLAEQVGEVLPQDMRQRVEQGQLDEATARELARSRAAATTAQDQVQLANDRMAQTQAMQSHYAIQQAVADWDGAHTAKDPDFERKRPMVEDAARTVMSRDGQATTPQAAVAVLDKALALVEERLSPFRPAPTTVPRQPSSTSAPTTADAAPVPKTLREAAELGLQGRYRNGP